MANSLPSKMPRHALWGTLFLVTLRIPYGRAGSSQSSSAHRYDNNNYSGGMYPDAPPPPPPPPSSNNNDNKNSNDFYDDMEEYPSWAQSAPPPPPTGDEEAWWNQPEDSGNNNIVDGGGSQYPLQTDAQQSQRPWQPTTERTPIHYSFPSRTDFPSNDKDDDNDTEKSGTNNNDDSTIPQVASARRDAVTRYWDHSFTHRLGVVASAAACGGSAGHALSTSIPMLNLTPLLALLAAASVLTRTAVGELMRACAVAVLWLGPRAWAVRRRYPTGRYLAPALGLAPRRAYPSDGTDDTRENENNREGDDDDYSRLYCLASLALVGASIGGALPVVPTSIGALSGSAALAWAGTVSSSRGDLARCAGMRVVGWTRDAMDTCEQLHVWPKLKVASRRVWRRTRELDEQHNVQGRVGRFATAFYQRVTGQEDEEDGKTENDHASNRRSHGSSGSDSARRRPPLDRSGPPPRRRSPDDNDSRSNRPSAWDDDNASDLRSQSDGPSRRRPPSSNQRWPNTNGPAGQGRDARPARLSEAPPDDTKPKKRWFSFRKGSPDKDRDEKDRKGRQSGAARTEDVNPSIVDPLDDFGGSFNDDW